MNPKITILLPAPERLNKAVIQTRGLLYAIAALAVRPADEMIVDVPGEEEARGLMWLALDLGRELSELTDEISTDYSNRMRAAHLDASGEQNGGAA